MNHIKNNFIGQATQKMGSKTPKNGLLADPSKRGPKQPKKGGISGGPKNAVFDTIHSSTKNLCPCIKFYVANTKKLAS